MGMLKPKQEFTLGHVDLQAGTLINETSPAMKAVLNDTVSLYQSASWLFRNGHLESQTKTP